MPRPKKVTKNERLFKKNPSLPAKGYVIDYTPELMLDVQKCKNDIFEFAKHFTIINPDLGKTKIELYPYQKRVLQTIVDNRFTVLLQSRQSGKSTVVTIYALHKSQFESVQRILIVANKEDTAKHIIGRIKTAYEELPLHLKSPIVKWGDLFIEFENGSVISGVSTSETTARGQTCNVMIVDEMAFIPDNLIENFWNSIVPVISASRKSKMIVVSTPNGVGNLFHSICVGAEKTGKDWNKFKIEKVYWWDIPGRDMEWKEDQLKLLNNNYEVFCQEYENKFLDVSKTVLASEVLKKMEGEKKEPIHISENGTYKIFKAPQRNHYYAMGVDVAEGVGQNYSVAQVIDLTDLQCIEQVAVFADNRIEPFNFAKVITEMAAEWGEPFIVLERNNSGGQVLDALKRHHQYPNLVSYVPSIGKDTEKAPKREGIFAHTSSKSNAVANMRYYLNTLQTVKIYDIDTVREYYNYIRHDNGTWKKRSNDYNDDRVEAMTWALFILDPRLCQNYFEIKEMDSTGRPISIFPLNGEGILTESKQSQIFSLLKEAQEEISKKMKLEKGYEHKMPFWPFEDDESENDPNYFVGFFPSKTNNHDVFNNREFYY